MQSVRVNTVGVLMNLRAKPAAERLLLLPQYGHDVQLLADALKDLRRTTIYELRQEGWTLQKIGDLMGVTPARVSQISNPDLPKKQQERLSVEEQALRREERKRLRAEAQQLSREKLMSMLYDKPKQLPKRTTT